MILAVVIVVIGLLLAVGVVVGEISFYEAIDFLFSVILWIVLIILSVIVIACIWILWRASR